MKFRPEAETPKMLDFSNPENIAGSSEHSQQCALLSAVAQIVEFDPSLKWFFAIPNGGDRNRVVAANLKAEGVKPGVADLMLPVARRGYHGFFVEMKSSIGQQSAAQKQFQQFVESQGYLYAVFHDWRSAFDALCWYLDINVENLHVFHTNSRETR